MTGQKAHMWVGEVPVCTGEVSEMAHGESLEKYSSIHYIVDRNTAKHCLPELIQLQLHSRTHVIEMPAGEEAKSLATCQYVWKELARQSADRGSLIINVGGGVVTDLGGFCAATYMRGIPFVHIPTSVLAMTDAAIGGKHGVDLDHYKNYVGLFADPQYVWVDVNFLATLQQRHIANGVAEVIKHGCIHDVHLLDMVDRKQEIDWAQLIPRSIMVKKHFVEADPYEQGLRAALNFGHTIGHALESFGLSTHLDLLHGEAIALGMQIEARLSRMLLDLEHKDVQRLDDVIGRVFPTLRMPDFTIDDIMPFLVGDKKNRSGEIRCVLLEQLGLPMTGCALSGKNIEETIREYRDEIGGKTP